jgi:cobalt-zinc-cadmium efflux system outer membrane protein
LQAARLNNPTLKSERLNIDLAQTDIITAKLRPNPVLNNQSLQLADPTYFPTGVGYESGRTRQIWWQLTKPFQLPSQRKHKIDFAEKKVIHAQTRYSEQERQLLLVVAGKWLEAWSAKKKIEVLRETKQKIDSLVNTAHVSSQTPTMLSAQYGIKLLSAQQEYENSLLNLRLAMGLKDKIDIDAKDDLPFMFSANMDSIIQRAMMTRGDILNLRSEIDLNVSNIKLQKVMARPVPELGGLYNPQNTIPYVGFFGTIQIPIFSRNQGEIKRAHLMKQQAEQNLEIAQQQLETEIMITYNTYKTQKQIVSDYKVILGQSRNNIKQASSSTGFIEAQKNHEELQSEYYDYLKQYYQTCIELLYNSGMINKVAE